MNTISGKIPLLHSLLDRNLASKSILTHTYLRPDSENDSYPKVISSRFGRNEITQIEADLVLKQGSSVWPNEEAAIQLVQAHAADVPVPTVYHAVYNRNANAIVMSGELYMDFVPGETLESAWPTLNVSAKERVCRETWALVEKLKEVPKPKAADGYGDGIEGEDDKDPLFYCAADGSPNIIHPFLGDEYDPPPPLRNDEALRARIWERYTENNGLSYPDGQSVRDMLPRSEVAVFTHGDIHPRNIMVDRSENDDDSSSSSGIRITGLIDFESAGFFPDYWEYTQMMRYGGEGDHKEWRLMMEQTAPKVWDVKGIEKVRRVLF